MVVCNCECHQDLYVCALALHGSVVIMFIHHLSVLGQQSEGFYRECFSLFDEVAVHSIMVCM